ncbi:MAG: carboxyltransferase domain-containing protein [Geminicoccaceae bacterium]|jgi:KipI family sensor histidine kinase inhibitor|nr:carboxyltransferase domain-containing protein [Geminicoccaceae bacterium]MCB9966047.1 carboxyltransferase domain-containing protein [Geminicoccaceae bacterium]HRY26459.1 carboxyltransferase domain-containing protein [Geminicoccaceae bacterium]
MIYDEPVFKPGGDRNLLVYLGDEMSFDLNFLVQTYAARIREAALPGLVELIPELASLLVSYDPDRLGYDDLIRELAGIRRGIGRLEGLELPSRLFNVPVLYFDPWTAACVDDYRAKLAEKEPDPDYLVRLNGLADRRQLVRVHSGTEYWVAALGFWPGLGSFLPLDPRCRLTAPKYNPPRTWTPKGTVGMGGSITCIYPDETPGGYQIFAISPMPIWDPAQRLAAFRDSLALFRPGDRVRFVPIDREEHDYITARVEDGSYLHPEVGYQRFSIDAYHAWLDTLDPTKRF